MNSNIELSQALERIKKKQKSTTKYTNAGLILCLLVLAIFFYVSAENAQESRRELKSMVAEVTSKNRALAKEVNLAREQLKESIENAQNEMGNIKESLTKAAESIDKQQTAALEEFSYTSRNRIEDLELDFPKLKGRVVVLEGQVEALATEDNREINN